MESSSEDLQNLGSSAPYMEPCGTLPESKFTAEDFVRAVLADHRQEMKETLYESCEQAFQTIAHRTLTMYMQSWEGASSTADTVNPPPRQPQNGQHLLALQMRARSSEASIPGFGTYLNLAKQDGREQAPPCPQVLGANSNELMPVAPQPRKVGIYPADTHLKKVSIVSLTASAYSSGSTSTSVDDSRAARVKVTVKHKAHTRKSLLSTTPPVTPQVRKSAAASRKSNRRSAGHPHMKALNHRDDATPAPAQGIFANAEAMKEKLRAAMTEEPYDVTDFYSETGWCQEIAKSSTLENVALAVIGFNALWISVDVDLNDATIITDSPPLFQVVDNFFCAFFLFEILVRFGAFEAKANCLKDVWFMFDSMMAIMMVFETWLLPIAIAIFAAKQNGNYRDASLLKGLRLARLIRMARVLRLLRALPELMVVIKGLYVATRAVSCTILLMLMIIYVFAVTFRQITDGTEIGRRYFPSVPTTMRYLLISGTMPDLTDSLFAIWDEGVFFGLCFLLFIFITSVTVMNMLVGILVGVIDTVASVEKEQLMVHFVKDHLLSLLTEMGAADDGLVSKQEFCKLIQTPEAIRSFTAMGVDVINLVDLADFLFSDDTVGIPFADFMEMVMQLRGSNQATVKDVVDLRRFVTMEMRNLFQIMIARVQPAMSVNASGNHHTELDRGIAMDLEDEMRGGMVVPGLHIQKTKSGINADFQKSPLNEGPQTSSLPAVAEEQTEALQSVDTPLGLESLASAEEQEGLEADSSKPAQDVEGCKKRKTKISRKNKADSAKESLLFKE